MLVARRYRLERLIHHEETVLHRIVAGHENHLHVHHVALRTDDKRSNEQLFLENDGRPLLRLRRELEHVRLELDADPEI